MEQFIFPRVKVISPENEFHGTKVYIDDKQIKKVTGIDFHVGVNELPNFTFNTIGLPNIDSIGNINFAFTPETVQEAVIVLRNELLKHGDLYDGFLASVVSAIKDSEDGILVYDLAEHILKRIVGDELDENKSKIDDGK